MPLEINTLSRTELAAHITSQSSHSVSQKATSGTNDHNNKQFLVVYASRDVNGRSWCGDCRNAEPLVNKKFGGVDEVVRVVYVGDRAEWRSVSEKNPWKEAPFSVEKLPTIIKIQDGKWERLVEDDVCNQKKLDAFVDA